MTKTTWHSVRDLLAEVRRLMRASELHVQFLGCHADVLSTMMVEGAIPGQGHGGHFLHVATAHKGVCIDAFSPARPGTQLPGDVPLRPEPTGSEVVIGLDDAWDEEQI